MLTYNDEQRVRQIIKDEVPDIVKKEVDRIEVKIDKVLKIVTRTDQEHKLTQTKLNKLAKRMVKVEKNSKSNLPPSRSFSANHLLCYNPPIHYYLSSASPRP